MTRTLSGGWGVVKLKWDKFKGERKEKLEAEVERLLNGSTEEEWRWSVGGREVGEVKAKKFPSPPLAD